MHNLCKLSVIRMEIRIWRQFKLEALTDSAVCVSRSAQCSGVRSFNRPGSPAAVGPAALRVCCFALVETLTHHIVHSWRISDKPSKVSKLGIYIPTTYDCAVILSWKNRVSRKESCTSKKENKDVFTPQKRKNISSWNSKSAFSRNVQMKVKRAWLEDCKYPCGMATGFTSP